MNQDHYDKVQAAISYGEADVLHTFASSGSLGQAAASLLTRSIEGWQAQFPEDQGFGTRVKLDLSGAIFASGASFVGASHVLDGANFRNAQLEGVLFPGVSLSLTDFTSALLREAEFGAVVCLDGGPIFHGADLSRATLDIIVPEEGVPPIDLRDGNLSGAKIQVRLNAPAIFTGANMAGCTIEPFATRAIDVEGAHSGVKALVESLDETQRSQVTIGPGHVPKPPSTCFIATAACSTASHPDVVLLRSFRDDVLLRSAAGRLFISVYTAISPPIADLIAPHPRLRALTRRLIVNPAASLASRLGRRE